MKKYLNITATIGLFCICLFIQSLCVAGEVVHVYSYRQPFLIKPILDMFTQKTGIEVKVIYAPKGLVERIEIEGKRSPADVVLTVDIGRLLQAADRIAQPVFSKMLQKNIPSDFRDREHKWFGLTKRARVVFVSKDRVHVKNLTYERLSDPKWRGRICTRSGQHPYNLALFASHMVRYGRDKTRQWLAGLKENLARRPSGNDRAQIRAVYTGECDIAIGNTYYMGKMQTNTDKPEQQLWAEAVRIIFPNRQTTGTHVNLSGMVMAKYAPNKQEARKLMEFLASYTAQKIYAEINFEYPIRNDVPISERVTSWGILKSDTLNLGKIGNSQQEASRIVDEVGYNH